MIVELVAALALLVQMALTGLPFALLLSADKRVRVPGALMLAPAFGIALQGLLSYPLYRYLGPVEVWGSTVAAVIALLAITCLYLQRRRMRLLPIDRREVVALLAASAVVFGVLAVPFLIGGLSRVIFSTNSSDALTYLTLADSVGHVDWPALWAGREPNPTPEAARVLALSDTALYSARFLAMPIRLATMIDLAWFGQLTGIPLERLSMAFMVAMSVAAAAAGLGLLRMFAVDLRLAGLGALIMALGYWAALLRANDSLSQVQALPVLIALVGARIASVPHATSLPLAALLTAGLVCIYTEFTVVLGLLVLAECGLFLLRERRLTWPVVEPLATAAATILLLSVTGQASFLWQVVQGQFAFVTAATRAVGSSPFGPHLVNHPMALVDGAAWLANMLRTPRLIVAHHLVEAVSALVSLYLLAMAVLTGLSAPRRKALLVTPLLLVVPMCLFALLVKRDAYVFFKLFSTVYPLLVAFVILITVSAAAARWPLRVLAWGSACLFLLAQSAYVGLWTWYEARGYSLDVPVARYKLDYGMEAMLEKLDEIQPRSLLVYLPASEQWQQSALWEFQLKRFRPFPQAGYLIDNRPVRLQHPLMKRNEPFDYAVVTGESDYLRESDLAEPVFSDGELILYRILQDSPMLHEYRP
jgi:hypothetical protein